MTDFERYSEILRTLTTLYDDEKQRAYDCSIALSFPHIPTHQLQVDVADLMYAYVRIGNALYRHESTTDIYATMCDKSRRALASALMHLLSPTWELQVVNLNTMSCRELTIYLQSEKNLRLREYAILRRLYLWVGEHGTGDTKAYLEDLEAALRQAYLDIPPALRWLNTHQWELCTTLNDTKRTVG